MFENEASDVILESILMKNLYGINLIKTGRIGFLVYNYDSVCNYIKICMFISVKKGTAIIYIIWDIFYFEIHENVIN